MKMFAKFFEEGRHHLLLPIMLLTLVMADPSLAQETRLSEKISAEETGDLLAIPEPQLEALEPRVRQQLSEQRALLDELLNAEDASGEERAVAFGELGRLYHFYDLVGSAVACFKNAQTLAPDDYRWPYYLGTLDEAEGRFESALAAYTRSAELDDEQLATLMRLAELQLRRRHFEEAESWYGKALEIRPKAAAALYGLGRIAAANGETARAIDYFEAALTEQPEANALYHPLGLAYRDSGDLEKAKQALSRAGRESVSFSDPLVRSLAQLAKGARVHQILGDRAQRKGFLPVAIDQYRKSLEIEPENGLVHYNLGTVLAQSGEEEQAIERYRDAVRFDPNLKNAHFNLAIALRAKGDLESAITHFADAVDIDPDDDEARLQLALTRLAAGDPATALAELETLRQRRPNAIGVNLPIARVLVAQGNLERAREELEALLRSPASTSGSKALAHLRLAEIASKRASEEDVRDHLKKAIEFDSVLVDAHVQLADSFGRTGEFNEAGRRYVRAIELDPAHERAHQGVALALVLTDRPSAAIQALEDGLRQVPSSMQLADSLARILASTSDPGLRDGERALGIAHSLFEAVRGPFFGETVGMGLAAAGRFNEAVPWQRRLLAEAEQGGLPAPFLNRLRANLERYEAGLIALPPW